MVSHKERSQVTQGTCSCRTVSSSLQNLYSTQSLLLHGVTESCK